MKTNFLLNKIGLYYRTVKHLKPIQIRYRLWHMLRDKLRQLTGQSYPHSIPKEGYKLNLEPGLPKPVTCNLDSEALAQESLQSPTSNFQPPKTFTFLNQSHAFEEAIDWNIKIHGKLWAYNLNYFDFLHQQGMTREQGLDLIREFIEKMPDNREGLEPYPISLRGINWIKFLSKYKIDSEEINANLYAQYQILLDNLEYHLMGNHLWENGCSLLFGGYYFQDRELYNTAKQILEKEVEEQILEDGGHFERSSMYQQILLERLLDCINLLSSCNWYANRELEKLIRNKAALMLGWLQQVSFKNGDIPMVNDSAPGIAPAQEELEVYARSLQVESKQVSLNESGYRMYRKGDTELFIDIGKIGPDYQPAHAHSDTFSFIFYYDDNPIIVDTGTSTYENNRRRKVERSTSAHNTIMIGDGEQSEVWSAFRVGRRAKPFNLEEKKSFIRASHDGYKHKGIIHSRQWQFNETDILITDYVEGNRSETSKAYLHIYPEIKPQIIGKDTFQVDNIVLSFIGCESSEIRKWKYPSGFNTLIDGYKLKICFNDKLKTQINYPL